MKAYKTKTRDAAIGRWPGILQALGIGAEYLRNKHGPCPVCGGKDRYRFDDKEGRGTWYCSQCGSGDGFGLLMAANGWNFAEAAKEVERVIGAVPATAVEPDRSEADKVDALRAVWTQARPVTVGDPVWKYLKGRTDLTFVPQDVRYHPELRYVNDAGELLGMYPAMLALMRYPDGNVASIHRTYLNCDGGKADVPKPKKMMAGKPLKTSAIQFFKPCEYLGIAEGVETALRASIRFCVPVWAASNAELLKAWVPPAGTKRVLIAGDNDASFTGQEAAYSLAKRLVREGYTVEVRIPDEIDRDWADK
jgi:putative DNA primase/helicase